MGEQATLVRPATRYVRSRVFDSAKWNDFPMRADDIVISTYSKCGTTWMQRIVGMMVFGSADLFPIQDSSPWPDFRVIPLEATLALAESQSHRRFIKSHLPFDALPRYAGVKYIHVARDGRDAAMSLFNHKTNYTPGLIAQFEEVSASDPKFAGTEFDFAPTDPVKHFTGWVDGPEADFGDPGGSYFAMENSFWSVRHDPDVLLVHYNDLKADREGEMRRIADFLEMEVSDDVWPQIVAAAGFEAMKGAASKLMPMAGHLWKGGGDTFLNKGTNGRWQGVALPEDLARYEAKVAAEFSPELAAWCEGGRLVAGDPREVPEPVVSA